MKKTLFFVFLGMTTTCLLLERPFRIYDQSYIKKPSNEKPNRSFSFTLKRSNNYPLIVLFTTHKNTSNRDYPQLQALHNWSQYRPHIQPVLFTDDNNFLTQKARELGWDILPQGKTNKFGTPYIKPMFHTCMSTYKASFYGFANADNIFDKGLLETLQFIEENLDNLSPVYISGQRWNYKFFHFNISDGIWQEEKIITLIRNSTLSAAYAQDYFIASQKFPWKKFKDLLIGRPGTDNYYLGHSIDLGINTIDASNTIFDVHVKPNGTKFMNNFQNVDANGNWKIFKSREIKNGYTSSAKYFTARVNGGKMALIPQKL